MDQQTTLKHDVEPGRLLRSPKPKYYFEYHLRSSDKMAI